MATHQLTPPSINFNDKRRAVKTPTGTQSHSGTFETNTASNDALDAALTAISATTYTAARLNQMTQNDKVYALRTVNESGSI